MEAFNARFLLAQITQCNTKALVKKRQFLQANFQCIEIEHRRFKDFRIWFENNSRTSTFRLANFVQFGCFMTARKIDFLNNAILRYLNLSPFTQRIDYGNTYTVKTAGHLIAATAEFTASMQFC